MKDWEKRIHEVDNIIWDLMKSQGVTTITPEECIKTLNFQDKYVSSQGTAVLFRNDLRKAREAGLPYYTDHIVYNQEENNRWIIEIRHFNK